MVTDLKGVNTVAIEEMKKNVKVPWQIFAIAEFSTTLGPIIATLRCISMISALHPSLFAEGVGFFFSELKKFIDIMKSSLTLE